jgi:tetratricopeptide (TPR) repeat protein
MRSRLSTPLPLEKQTFRLVRRLFVVILLLTTSGFYPRFSSAFQSDAQKEVHAKTVLIRGLTQLRIGFPDKAATLFAEGLGVNPVNTALLSSMADAQFAVGDVSLAIFYAEKALALDPENIELNKLALFLFKEAGDAINAVRYSAKLIALNPTDPEPHIAHILLLKDLGLTNEALASANQALLAFPQNETLLRTALPIFMSAGSLSDATHVASEISALTADPEDVFELSRILVQNGEMERARDLLQALASSDPDFDQATSTLNVLSTQAAADQGQTSNANEPSDLAETDPLIEANRLFSEGQFEQAATLAQAQIEADPRKLDMWVLAVRSLIELNQTPEAIFLAEDGGLLFPGYAPLLFQHARALRKSNRQSEAIEKATKALENLDPNSVLFKEIQTFLGQSN